jgi:pimeloyl-ACP methyl ester carboxylesterase
MSLGAWVVLALVAAPLLVLTVAVLAWWRWKRGLLAASRVSSRVARTALGSVEYAVAGQGPPLLVIHGGMGGHDQALGLGALVNAHAGPAAFTVLAPSRPGYSRTPLQVGATPEEQADALAAWLDHLGVAQVGVLAGSYGGPVAVQLALRHPHRLWALVLLAAILRRCTVGQQWPLSDRNMLSWRGGLLMDLIHWLLCWRARSQPLALIRAFTRQMTARSVDDAEIARRVARLGLFPEQVRAVQALFCSMMPLSVQMAGCLNDEKQIAALPDYPLEEVRAPTLFVHGRDDCVGSGAAGAEWAAARVPGARLFLVEQCGHFMQAGEHVAPAFSAIAEFLWEHAPPRGGIDTAAVEACQEPVAPLIR